MIQQKASSQAPKSTGQVTKIGNIPLRRVKKQLLMVHPETGDKLPVKDAKKDLTLRFGPTDVRDAVQSDEHRCVIAKSCKRLGISTAVHISKSFAYLLSPEEDCFVRYELNGKAQRLVKKFDSGSEDYDLNGVKLWAPKNRQVLGSKHIRLPVKKPGSRGPRRSYIVIVPTRRKPEFRFSAAE